MRIVLVTSQLGGGEPATVVPTGILSLAAYLEEKGHCVQVVDAGQLLEAVTDTVKRVELFEPELIGIGGIVTGYFYAVELSNALKNKMPETPIVLGGQVTVNTDEYCFKHMAIDYSIHGYGEIALEKLVRYLSGQLDIKDIPGLSYRDGGDVIENPGREFFKNINEMPLPAYHLIDMEPYITTLGSENRFTQYFKKNGLELPENQKYLTIMGSLGCTDRCAFCIHEQEYVGLKYYSYDYLLDHIALVKEKYGVNFIGIGEEMFITKLDRAKKFNAFMKERFPDIYWTAATRADFVTPDMVKELETGNCIGLVYGFETGSQTMLDLIKKRMDAETNILSYQLLSESKLVEAATIMVGNVGETFTTVQENIHAIKRAGMVQGATFFATPYPGGRTWDWAIERGVISDPHQYLLEESCRIPSSDLVINLTPYPDWVLKSWRELIMCTCATNQLGRVSWTEAFKGTLKERLRYIHYTLILVNKSFFAFGRVKKVPRIAVSLACATYSYWHYFSRKIYKTKKDRQYAYSVDKDGALLPDNLIVLKPQRFLSPKQLEIIKKQKEIRIKLEANTHLS